LDDLRGLTAADRRDPLSPVAVGVGSAPGTFGELLQGVLDGLPADFLVTLPIVRGSHATFRFDRTATEILVNPSSRQKSARLAAHLLADHGVLGGGDLTIQSTLPDGKGLGSSSSDLVATARAVAMALGVSLSPTTIEELLRQIEPSDGLMYSGVVAFYHREVRLLAQLGAPPPLTVVGVDEGGEVDTISFNRLPKPYNEDERREYSRLLVAVRNAVRSGDVRTIGRVASRSAVLSQRMRARPLLREMLVMCRSVDGLGVVVAHSGTVMGILLDASDPLHQRRVEMAMRSCESVCDNVWTDEVRAGRHGLLTRSTEDPATDGRDHRDATHQKDPS
jgi:uncharacterized protein involved in propanediol utilization